MKIVQVLTRGDVLGGAQSHVHDLCVALKRAGHDVTVITGRPGIFNERLAGYGISQLSIDDLVRPVRPWRDVRALVALVKAFRQLKPDLVCAHTAKAGWLARTAAKLLGIPSTFTPHGWSMIDRGSLKPRAIFLWAERLAGYMGTRTINVCEYERQLATSFRVAAPQSLDVVHNGIADMPFARTRPVTLQPPTLVMVARYEPQKDHEMLLQALADLTHLDWQLALVGEGEREAAIRDQITMLKLGDRVRLLPGNTDVAELLFASQIFVLATKFEAFPISILEAMRAGLPVVATDVGGIAEAVGHQETGLLVPAGDRGALRDALGRLIAEPALRSKLGDAGRARYLAHFTSELMVEDTLRVYDRARSAPSTQVPVVEAA
jgi:glycosyltransferase involved in cell wall biosynthesis